MAPTLGWPFFLDLSKAGDLFSLEDSLPQASFVAASNARYVSVKQGKERSLTTVPKLCNR